MRLIDLLTELKQSYEIGLVTNGVAAWQYDKLEAMGISQLFEPGSIFISEEVGYEKPAPEIFLKALEHFKYFRRKPCLLAIPGEMILKDPARLGSNQFGITMGTMDFQIIICCLERSQTFLNCENICESYPEVLIV